MIGHPYEPQGAICPTCGRHVSLTIDGYLECHSPLGDPHAAACPRTLPALPKRARR